MHLTTNIDCVLNRGASGSLREKRSVENDEALAKEFLSSHNLRVSDMCYKSNIAEWRYASDITKENERLKVCPSFH